ncbi:acyl-CoA dehydrogenase [Lysobacter gummosus]|uniref:Acyl-CoA dehydrogenase n=1 Tax=Lysobacter gummosus TaxID=262324 RepID=A0ABY3X884_9GAMM|nr:acyl-CoA dehydrogenase [Lysobacter gummosus]ALN93312.1 acyl-CoA dehydrogenase, N-terminal domain protein [Lysobacter gummosus]UNP28799.1 acyl-CoA dehydrogenase [Lysobacter gummosus]
MSSSPLIDRRHLDFMLYELLEVERLARYPRFAEHGRETFDAAIELAHQLAVSKFLPHNRKSDLNEPRMVDGRVELIPEIGESLRAFNEAGFMAVLADFEDGGMQLPFVIGAVCDCMFSAANPSTVAYPALARGVANLLEAYASDEQKRLYMKPIVDGRYYGTMCLSEPQAGSSLADIKTQAEPQADGSYRISGAKMWISAGDHELGENIVHLVLAKIPGGPPGVRGISLFIVPRWRVGDDGARGPRNDVSLAGLNHKMGQRGSVNTFLKFGESGDCHGYLVGQPHQGLTYMFHMMNEERIGVGLGAVQQGSAAYLYSLQYARERRQGRHPDQKDPASPPLPLIEHADVRRMLLLQKCWVEGAQALGFYTALLVDQALDPDDTVRGESALLLDLLTPIIKAWGSDYSLKANELAIQILGGYGYTREYPVEQCYRDNRINPIHEGTNGIQALDLLGRKAMMQNGAALKLLLREIGASCAQAAALPELQALAAQLGAAAKLAGAATAAVGQRMAAGEVRLGLANAGHYMTLLGHVVIGWLWLRQATIAQNALATASEADTAFYQGKLQACRFFFAHELPQVELAAKLVSEAEPSAHAMRAEWF